MRQTLANSYLFGANAPFIEELYERYLDNPAAVEPAWRERWDDTQRLPMMIRIDVEPARGAKWPTLYASPREAPEAACRAWDNARARCAQG
jgi:2-oxoglutarate dehydrogenase complex dehydrogenase (E1) component-like enzyme